MILASRSGVVERNQLVARFRLGIYESRVFGQFTWAMHSGGLQLAFFCLVGALNTLIDFAAYNLLAGKRFRWRRVPANVVSGTIGMLFSFFMNLFFVFRSDNLFVL